MSDPAGRPPSVPEVPDVAVVVPVRNAEATLVDAVASALAQELDGTLEVCIAVGRHRDKHKGSWRRLAAACSCRQLPIRADGEGDRVGVHRGGRDDERDQT